MSSTCTKIVIVNNTGPVSIIKSFTQQGLPGPPGPVGPAGPIGPQGGNTSILLTATVSGGAAVSSEGAPADVSNPFLLIGIALQGGNVGDTIQIMSDGLVTEQGYQWQPESAIYLGSNGALTQIEPTSGFLQVVGFAQTNTSIFVRPQAPIAQ